MTYSDDEIARLIRQVIRDDQAEIPDDYQLPDSFWERLAGEAGPRPDAAPIVSPHSHRGRAGILVAAACLVAVAVGGAAIGVSRMIGGSVDTSPPLVQSLQPAPPVVSFEYAIYRPVAYHSDTCVPGPVVHPTRTPGPAADTIVEHLDPSMPASRARIPFYTQAFEPIVEAGGCVQAWMLPRGDLAPSDATGFRVGEAKFSQRRNDDGLTEVYLHRDQVTYVAASGNASAQDLAMALEASITPPSRDSKGSG